MEMAESTTKGLGVNTDGVKPWKFLTSDVRRGKRNVLTEAECLFNVAQQRGGEGQGGVGSCEW